MPPHWVQIAAEAYVPLSVATALLVLTDMYLLGRRQPIAIMEAVWPLTTLYWGPLGLLFYFWFGRGAMPNHSAHHHELDHPMWQAAFTGATHCGAGCALGDFIGDWLAFALSFALLGSVLLGKYLFAFVLAYLFGIFFQYFSVAPMRCLGLREGVVAAIKIDTLSLVAYEVGMFAGMGFRSWLFPDLQPTTWACWLMMQVAMVLGFLTTYPVNWWLIGSGIKEKMSVEGHTSAQSVGSLLERASSEKEKKHATCRNAFDARSADLASLCFC
jgi:hypothetical protein